MESYKREIEDDFNIKEIFKILKEYYWLIFITTILSILFASQMVYFSKPIYSSYSIVKVKPSSKDISKKLTSSLNNKSVSETRPNIKEDIVLLKTFFINNQALNLNRINFKVQYYINKNYKDKEIYTDLPIEVRDIKIIDSSFIGYKLKITPKKDGYTIQFVHSLKNRIANKLFKKPLLKIENRQIFRYAEMIKTKFFNLRIDKFSNFNEPINIVINGDNQYIYDNLIQDNLDIIQVDESVPHIKISYKDVIPERAIAYTKSLTDSFINESLTGKSKQNNQILNFIRDELSKVKKQLKKSEEELERYSVVNKIIKPSEQASTFIKELSHTEISLSENQLKVDLINSVVKFINRGYNIDTIAPSLIELKDSSTLKLISILQDTEFLKNELLAEYTKEYPKIIILENKMANIKKKIILNMKSLQKQILHKNKNLKERKNSYEKRIESLPSKERRIINIKRDYEVNSKMYKFLLEREAENEILKVANLSSYQIIDEAYKSLPPIRNKNGAIMVSSIFIGFLLAVLLIVLHRIFSSQILSIKDIKAKIDTPIYGVIPFLKSSRAKKYLSTDECYDRLRTNLQLLDNEPRVIILSSNTDNEGKDIATINLSISFSKVDYRVIIIDLDMRSRNSQIDTLLNIKYNNSGGIADYLTNKKNSLGNVIYSTQYDNLSIIPAGENLYNVSKLLQSKQLAILIKKLKEFYDYIIINTPPLEIVADSKHIMKLSDINLIIFKENKSSKESIINLKKLKDENSIDNIGVLFLTKRINRL